MPRSICTSETNIVPLSELQARVIRSSGSSYKKTWVVTDYVGKRYLLCTGNRMKTVNLIIIKIRIGLYERGNLPSPSSSSPFRQRCKGLQRPPAIIELASNQCQREISHLFASSVAGLLGEG